MSQPRRFRPTLWPTVFTIPALIVLVGLGLWQVDRLQWKTALIETFEARVAEAPAPPPQAVDDIEPWRYRRIQLRGVFQHEKEFLITGKTFEGTAGFHVITPMLLEDDRIILVNRG